jgi:hypothetical protein
MSQDQTADATPSPEAAPAAPHDLWSAFRRKLLLVGLAGTAALRQQRAEAEGGAEEE